MKQYEKIETLYNRSMDGSKALIMGDWRNPTVEYLRSLPWQWTEKIDGTNVRIYWDGHSVSFAGRTDRASIPTPLIARLEALFLGETTAQVFEQLFGEREVILFGEGYGAGIQNPIGKAYNPDGVDFILFDVQIGYNYQPREFVEEIATVFGIRAVPIVGEGTLDEAVAFIRREPQSRIGACKMEGVVCRPKLELRDRCGDRIIVKVKSRDFPPEAAA